MKFDLLIVMSDSKAAVEASVLDPRTFQYCLFYRSEKKTLDNITQVSAFVNTANPGTGKSVPIYGVFVLSTGFLLRL